MIKILCQSSDDLERIHREVKSIEGVATTKTHFILKNIKDTFCVIPKTED